jgi:parallel beta-helix repeat protein
MKYFNKFVAVLQGKSRVTLILFGVIVVMLSFSLGKLNAATYYVRTDGNNNCNGLYNQAGSSGNCAWKTLQQAADVVVAGDVVNVIAGTYQGFMIQAQGTSSNPILFKAVGTGVNITTHNPSTNDGINIESWGSNPSDYITVDGFNIYSQPRCGIRAIGGTGIVIQNCLIHDNIADGILCGDTPNIKILNNISYHNGYTTAQWGHGIYVSNAKSDNPIVRGNIVYNNYENGIQINGDYTSGGDGYIDNPLIENNTVYGNGWKGFSLISIRYGTIQNNVLYNNGSRGSAGGIHIVEQGSTYYSINNTVVNNSIHETLVAGIRINANNTNNVVFNNIVIGGTTIVFEGSGNYQSNNITGSSAGTLFIDASTRNYHLAAGSGAINSGVSSYLGRNAPSFDKDGVTRSAPYDVGAYEFVSTTTPIPPQKLKIIN